MEEGREVMGQIPRGQVATVRASALLKCGGTPLEGFDQKTNHLAAMWVTKGDGGVTNQDG